MSGSADHRVGVTGASRVGGVDVGDPVGGVEVCGGPEIAVELAEAAGGPDGAAGGCAGRVGVLTVIRGALGRGAGGRARAVGNAIVGWGSSATVGAAVSGAGLNGVPGFVGPGEAISATVITTGTDPPATHHSTARRSRRRAPGG